MTDTKQQIGYGLMGFSWRAEPVADEQAFEAMRAAVQAGALHWSTATFYGPPNDPLANIKLLRRYFDAYPEDANKVQIYVKGSLDVAKGFAIASSEDDIRASLQSAKDVLGTSKSVDFFGPARRDKSVPIGTSMQTYKKLVEEGAVKGIFLSEVGAETIREAHKVQPLSAIEVEFSLWSPELLENGVGQATKELNIPILAYSPLGRGFLTGAIQSINDIPEGDVRRRMERFEESNLDKNVRVANKIVEFSKSINATPAQVAIAWIYGHAEHTGPLIPIPGASHARRVEENSRLINLSDEQLSTLTNLLSVQQVAGGRAGKHGNHMLWA